MFFTFSILWVKEKCFLRMRLSKKKDSSRLERKSLQRGCGLSFQMFQKFLNYLKRDNLEHSYSSLAIVMTCFKKLLTAKIWIWWRANANAKSFDLDSSIKLSTEVKLNPASMIWVPLKSEYFKKFLDYHWWTLPCEIFRSYSLCTFASLNYFLSSVIRWANEWVSKNMC